MTHYFGDSQEQGGQCDNCGCGLGYGQSGLCDNCQFEQTGDDPWVINYYHCDDCGREWQGQNDGPCTERCSHCGKESEPYSSVETR